MAKSKAKKSKRAEGCCEAGEVETIGMLTGVQLRPKSPNKKNDRFVVGGKTVEEYHPKTKSEDEKGEDY